MPSRKRKGPNPGSQNDLSTVPAVTSQFPPYATVLDVTNPRTHHIPRETCIVAVDSSHETGTGYIEVRTPDWDCRLTDQFLITQVYCLTLIWPWLLPFPNCSWKWEWLFTRWRCLSGIDFNQVRGHYAHARESNSKWTVNSTSTDNLHHQTDSGWYWCASVDSQLSFKNRTCFNTFF